MISKFMILTGESPSVADEEQTECEETRLGSAIAAVFLPVAITVGSLTLGALAKKVVDFFIVEEEEEEEDDDSSGDLIADGMHEFLRTGQEVAVMPEVPSLLRRTCHSLLDFAKYCANGLKTWDQEVNNGLNMIALTLGMAFISKDNYELHEYLEGIKLLEKQYAGQDMELWKRKVKRKEWPQGEFEIYCDGFKRLFAQEEPVTVTPKVDLEWRDYLEALCLGLKETFLAEQPVTPREPLTWRECLAGFSIGINELLTGCELVPLYPSVDMGRIQTVDMSDSSDQVLPVGQSGPSFRTTHVQEMIKFFERICYFTAVPIDRAQALAESSRVVNAPLPINSEEIAETPEPESEEIQVDDNAETETGQGLTVGVTLDQGPSVDLAPEDELSCSDVSTDEADFEDQGFCVISNKYTKLE